MGIPHLASYQIFVAATPPSIIELAGIPHLASYQIFVAATPPSIIELAGIPHLASYQIFVAATPPSIFELVGIPHLAVFQGVKINRAEYAPTTPPGYATVGSELTETDNEPPFRVF